jgi:redox-sensitive bicupin YhaK (pirin superfamily)
MMILRPSQERGHADHGWLKTWHTFSFNTYYDPRHMNFRSLRVINEDWVAPGQGFGAHPHRDMEIVTYVLEGALEHRDSLGHGSVIRPGEIQKMSAGTGITHSEFNPSKSEPLHLLQIWMLPDREGLPPMYEQKTIDLTRHGIQKLPVSIHQDAAIYVAKLQAGATAEHPLAASRHAWVQVARGALSVNGTPLSAGDGAAVSEEARLAIVAREDAEALIIDLG